MFSYEEILKAVNGKVILQKEYLKIERVSTDSRDIKKGDLFIPIVGEKYDGHDYIEMAFEHGAVAVITHKDIIVNEKFNSVIKVEDTLIALGKLANYYRSKFKIPLVGITGSVGKTSTKEMIASVLGEGYCVLKTAGNFNNEIGLPLTLFNLEEKHQVAVIEMGMSGFGEISRLSKIAVPKIAVVTNIGSAHIEQLGSKKNILKAKMEILDGLSNEGVVILNGDDSLLESTKGLIKNKTIFYGTDEYFDYRAHDIRTVGEKGSTFELITANGKYSVFVPAPGIHNVYNALAAIAVGFELKVPIEKIIAGISKYKPEKMRMEIIHMERIKVINDAYNANPQSMRAAIDVLREIGGKNRKIAILGDMLELGEASEDYHKELGEFAVQKGMDIVIAIGQYGESIKEGAIKAGINEKSAFSVEDINEQLNSLLIKLLREKDICLVKGSRGMKMERIVEFIKKHF